MTQGLVAGVFVRRYLGRPLGRDALEGSPGDAHDRHEGEIGSPRDYPESSPAWEE